MELWHRLVAFLAVTTAVFATPLLNELPPGKEWPERLSVKQPFEPEKPTESPEYYSTFSSDLAFDEKPSENINEVLPALNEKVENIEAADRSTSTGTNVEKSETINENLPQVNEKADQKRETNESQKDVLGVAKDAEKENKVNYSGAQVWKVSTEDSRVRTVIGRLRRRNLIATWSGNHSYVDVFVKPHAVENVTRAFKRENIEYDIIIDDLQKRIDEENPPLDQNEIELQDRRGHRMTWKQYHRLEDIHGFLDYLAKTYSAIISVRSIGKSFEGRDLKVLRISNGKPSNKAVFIDGGMHAREWISPATVTYFINQFAENFDEEEDDIRNIDWYFLPVVNPDGYEYTHTADRLWRKNRKPAVGRQCAGTDLNRNFGYRWGGKGASANPCSDIFRGNRMFSEPESKALGDFIKNTAANFTAYLTYHSYGQYILYPWGYDNVVPPDHKTLDDVGKSMADAIKQIDGSKYTVGSSSGVLYPAAGGSDDWAKGQGIKYSFTIELGDTGRYGFILPTSYIEPVAKESLAGLRVLAHYVNKY
ncbi:carboxypeptidase B-like [Pieris napi]|uniref:carboxypeptidase B-like n=1 Tax=Pieris napi TaxID=78633 RepID=UPI001FBBC36D|nr:carboxypeptidase B-like [Pieris napi]